MPLTDRKRKKDDVDIQEGLEARNWNRFATGGEQSRSSYWTVRRDRRGYPVFVAGTQVDGQKEKLPQSLSQASTDGKAAHSVEMSIHDRGEVSAVDESESLASLYARLTRSKSAKAPSQEKTEQIQPTVQRLAVRPKRPRQEWFIQKALAVRESHLDAERKDEERLDGLRCSDCQKTFTTGLELKLHRSSIAHLLVSDKAQRDVEMFSHDLSTEASFIQSPSVKHGGALHRRVGKICLKQSNVGHIALERMGWRRGIGLGRNEWMMSTSSQQLAGDTRSPSIESATSTGEHRDAGNPEERTSWETLPSQSMPDKGFFIEQSVCHSDERDRPLLEPIPVHLRSDRRGIGFAFPSFAAKESRCTSTMRTHDQPIVKRRDRIARAEEDRAEHMATRARLNW